MKNLISVLFLCWLVDGCSSQEIPSTASLTGTYHANVGDCELSLVLQPSMDYLYAKKCSDAGKDGLLNQGHWEPEKHMSDPGITFYGFKWGLAPYGGDSDAIWNVAITKSWFGLGKARLCFDVDLGYCFVKESAR